jgi:mannose-1-phosphate guanylyltransferase
MKAIILVGGIGSRLRPLTYDRPKQMLPLVGVPMIEHVLKRLARHGITDAVLALGYLPDRFIEAYPSGVIAGVNVTYAVEPESLDTAGAIRFAANYANVDETFLVANGDVLTDLDVTKLLEFHREHGAEATIALHPVEDPSRFGVVPTTPEGQVVSFVEKPERHLAPTNLINAGTYVFEPSVLDRIAPTGRVSLEREIFPNLATSGTLYAMPDHAYWLDAGTPMAFLEANAYLVLDQFNENALADFMKDSWIHPLATVDPSSKLVGSVVDQRCSVGPNVELNNVVLLPGAVVKEGARIRSSIIGPNAVIGSLSNLGATCVVGANFEVASNSVLSGDVRLGG